MNSKILIIAGMHRSGTSLVTQWLYRCGLFIGEKLLEANAGNMDGHFEDKDFLALHERFLSARKLPDTGFTDKTLSPLGQSEKELIQILAEKRSSTHKEWGWKEPRTCLFLDAYRDVIPSACYLVITRDFNSTVNSMLAREHKLLVKKIRNKIGLSKLKWMLFKNKSIEAIYRANADHYLKVWINYYEHILYHLQQLPESRFTIVRYEYLLQNSSYIFGRLKNEWKFSLNYVPFSAVFKKELLSESKDIGSYIRDISLLDRAKEIEKTINKLFLQSVKAGTPGHTSLFTGSA